MNNIRYELPDGDAVVVPDTDAVPRKGEEVAVSGREGLWEVEKVHRQLQVYPSTAIQTTIVELGPA